MPSESKTPSNRFSGHLPALDGVRGLAIVLVLFHHVLGNGPALNGFSDALFSRLASVGWIGVDLFFVLSGFLITGILLNTRHRPGFLKNFFVRRAQRIVPLYFGFLCLVWTVFPHLFDRHPNWATRFNDEKLWYFTYLVNFALPFRFDDWPPYSLVHLWSLSVEQHFYLLWPLLFLVLGPRGLAVTCLVILCLSPVARGALLAYDQTIDWALASGRTRINLANYMFTPLRLDAIAMGSLVRILLAGDRPAFAELLPRLLRWSSVLLLLVFVAQRATLPGTAVINQVLTFSLLAVVFGALTAQVALGRAAPLLHRLMTGAPLRTLGKYSYSMYLFHLPLQSYLVEYVYPRFLPWLDLAEPVGRLLHFGSVTGLSLVIAWLTWHLLEQPFLRLKPHFQ